MRIYLAGGKGDWRETVYDLISKSDLRGPLDLYDPFTRGRQGAIYEFTQDDLQAVAGSDLILGYCNFERYSGMALEFGYAYAKGIPIIYVAGQPRIDSMMVGVAKAAFTDLDAAVEFVIERYLT